MFNQISRNKGFDAMIPSPKEEEELKQEFIVFSITLLGVEWIAFKIKKTKK